MQFSRIDREGIKADCDGCMKSPSNTFNLEARILVATLYMTLHKAIGKICFTLLRVVLFGIRAMKVWLTT